MHTTLLLHFHVNYSMTCVACGLCVTLTAIVMTCFAHCVYSCYCMDNSNCDYTAVK